MSHNTIPYNENKLQLNARNYSELQGKTMKLQGKYILSLSIVSSSVYLLSLFFTSFPLFVLVWCACGLLCGFLHHLSSSSSSSSPSDDTTLMQYNAAAHIIHHPSSIIHHPSSLLSTTPHNTEKKQQQHTIFHKPFACLALLVVYNK